VCWSGNISLEAVDLGLPMTPIPAIQKSGVTANGSGVSADSQIATTSTGECSAYGGTTDDTYNSYLRRIRPNERSHGSRPGVDTDSGPHNCYRINYR